MAYDGYLRLNGVEIANAARTTRYLDNLLPTFGLKGCQDCEALEASLGETYTTPVTDNAPWYDPSMPSSASFFGFYPLSIEGIDDSTREAVTTELVGDGSITNRPRFAGRDIRVNGLLVGATEQAVDTGMAWLGRALSGPCEGGNDCLGGDLNFYSSCPQVQDWSGTPIFPLDWADDSLGNETFLWTPSDEASFVTSGTPGQLGFSTATAGDYFTRQVSGLIPGETYRLTLFGTDSSEGVRVTVVEGSEFTFDFHHIFLGTGPADLPQVLDFVAPSDTIQVRLQAWNFETDSAGTAVFTINNMTIQRTQIHGTILQTEYNQFGTPSGSWQTPIVVGTTVLPWQRVVSESRVYTTVVATTGTISYPSGSYIQRPIQNTGGRTRVTVAGKFTEDTYAGTLSPTMVGASDVETVFSFVDPVSPSDLFFTFTLEFDFANAGLPAYVQIATTAATTIGDSVGSGAQWSVHYLLVEAVDDPLLIDDPNPGLEFERVLRQVKATSGPVTAERFSPTCGAMRRVTFSLRAGVPHHFGSPALVGNAFGSEAASIPEVECSFDEPVRYNYVLDPRFLTSTGISFTGFTAVGVGVNASSPTGRVASFTGGTTAGTMTFTYSLAGAPTLTPDSPYTFGIFLRRIGAGAATVDQVTLSIVGATTVTTTTSNPVTIPAVDSDETWTPVTITGVAPVAATSFTITLTITRTSGATLLAAAPMFTFGTSIEGYDESWSHLNFPTGSALFVDGVSPGRAATPDQPALDVVGDIDIRALAALDDWTPSATQVLVSKWNTTGNQRSFILSVLSTGILRFDWSNNGTAALTADSTVAPTVANGEPLWVRVAFDVDNGAAGRTATFYTSPADDGVNWTQLGAAVTTATVTSIFASTSELAAGAYQAGTLGIATGRIFAAEVRNGIAGTVVANPNFAAQAPDTTSFVDSIGNTWTVTSPAEISGTGVPPDLGYFDGTYPDADWVGTANASQSVTVPAEDTPVQDPNCLALPDPPAPPTIDNDCLTTPTSWNRYVIDVPSRFIPVTAGAEPIATITTTASLNNVRMRFYPADLGPFATCGFVGEMLLSYVPANSTVILDATQHTATLVRVGFEDQSVTHLLYGPDGGPVQWPSLTCGTAYLFMVDVEPTGDISGSQVELEMAVKY